MSKDIDISDLQLELSDEEEELVLSILNEYASSGSSPTMDAIYYQDYEEIPVDIYTFLTDRRFLGNAFLSDDGKLLIYKYWVDVLEKIFSVSSQTIEVALSGAIGLGKSTIACIGLCYILYKLLCLKNPASYYKLTKGSKIALALFNINLDQGYGVGYAKLQAMLKQSPWFLDNGTLAGTKNPTYYPGKDIEILVGSKMEHFIGRDVFCLQGDEEVLTDKGYIKISELSGNKANIFSQDDDGNLVIASEVDIIKTKDTDEIYEIELDDGSIIKCTPEHRFRLSDGSYKMAKDLTEYDDLMEVGL